MGALRMAAAAAVACVTALAVHAAFSTDHVGSGARSLPLAEAGAVAVSSTPQVRSRPRVVLDPGHGGGNAGAPSIRPDVFEKDITLALAFEMRPLLQARGIDVILTRDRDDYLTLRDRTRVALRVGADAFVSLHANATENHSQSGYETFILSTSSADVDAPALRGTDGAHRPGVDALAKQVLDDAESAAAIEGAAHIATQMQKALEGVRGSRGNRGVKQGSQHVLLGATMPAVLVEIGFIDHPVEGAELLDEELRSRIAHALADALVAALCESDSACGDEPATDS